MNAAVKRGAPHQPRSRRTQYAESRARKHINTPFGWMAVSELVGAVFAALGVIAAFYAVLLFLVAVVS